MYQCNIYASQNHWQPFHQDCTKFFFISNQGQASALKVAYIFKVFGAQSCLMVA